MGGGLAVPETHLGYFWRNDTRPGFFGRRRDELIAGLNARHGAENWRIVWIVQERICNFEQACKEFYEESYYRWLKSNAAAVEHITSFSEVYDNSITNIASGLDYQKQEAFATHIQDIAVRNSLRRLGVWFRREHKGPMQIRGAGEGAQYNPGHVPFYDPALITKPSLRPQWAAEGSVEDFWQSNKWIQVRERS
jgi:hypothetical protein